MQERKQKVTKVVPIVCNATIIIIEPFQSYLSVRLLGPVVQSIVSLTRSLSVILLTVLADSIHNILIFFAEKM